MECKIICDGKECATINFTKECKEMCKECCK